MTHLQQYIDHIRNTGRVPLPIEQFDEDWEPIGPMVRRDLVKADLVEERDGGLILKDSP